MTYKLKFHFLGSMATYRAFVNVDVCSMKGGKPVLADVGMFGYPLKVRIQSGLPSAKKNGSRDPKKRHFREVLNCKRKNLVITVDVKNPPLGCFLNPYKK